MTIQSLQKTSSIRTAGKFLKGRACSDTLFNALNCAFGHPLNKEERAAMPLAGGIMQHGYQCGIIWGATLAAGAQAYRLFGPGPLAETKAILAAQRLVKSFRAHNEHINCFDISHIDKSSSTRQMMVYFLVKGGSISCIRMASRYVPVALGEINRTFSEKSIAVPTGPISCATMLAKKMGISSMHAVMAAGLAGGIGLCGGACGALGAAIWITAMNICKKGGRKINFKHPLAIDVIDRFMKCTDYEFECSEIVGRKFESIDDHARFLRGGGCSDIIAVLAAK